MTWTPEQREQIGLRSKEAWSRLTSEQREARKAKRAAAWAAKSDQEKKERAAKIDLGGVLYVADFVLPESKIIIEVKGQPKARKRWNEKIVPALHQWSDRSWIIFVLGRKVSGTFRSLQQFLSTMDQLKLGELLEHPESFADHNVAGNGKRDGLKTAEIGQSAAALPVGIVQVEGSTTRPVSPNNNPVHEYPGSRQDPDVDHDIVCSTDESRRSWDKKPNDNSQHGADRRNVDREQPSPHPRPTDLVAVVQLSREVRSLRAYVGQRRSP